jgi:hypothetical protein
MIPFRGTLTAGALKECTAELCPLCVRYTRALQYSQNILMSLKVPTVRQVTFQILLVGKEFSLPHKSGKIALLRLAQNLHVFFAVLGLNGCLGSETI